MERAMKCTHLVVGHLHSSSTSSYSGFGKLPNRIASSSTNT